MYFQTVVEWSYRIWIWGLIAKDFDVNMGDFQTILHNAVSVYKDSKSAFGSEGMFWLFFPLLKSYFLKSWAYQCAAVHIGRLGRIPWNRRLKEEPKRLCRHYFVASCVCTCPEVLQKFPLCWGQALPCCALLWNELLMFYLPLTRKTFELFHLMDNPSGRNVACSAFLGLGVV